MRKKTIALVKILVIIALVAAFVWFLILSPMLTFQKYEKEIEDAAKRYYDFHSSELPTGERVKTLSLTALYDASLLKGTYYAPISHNACSVEKSWAKVRKENGNYKYYVYLDCGRMQSKIDHEGPVIKLKGKEEIKVNIGDKFKDPGVDSVIDENDGKIDVSTVTIRGDVDTSKVGTYEIKYTAYDELRNKTTVKRTVIVEKLLNKYIKQDLGDEKYYKGDPKNNYVIFSKMYFRVVGLTEDDNVIMIAEEDVSNVSYKKLENWIDDVYMKAFTKESKKLMLKHEFCSSTVKESEIHTKECKDKTKARYAFVPSIADINKAELDGKNFMWTGTMSWTADHETSKEAWVERIFFFSSDDQFWKDNATYNYGVRPMIVIKGKTKVIDGDGSHDNPYKLEDFKKVKNGDLLNKGKVGDVVDINGTKWIVVEPLKDGTTKLVSYITISNTSDFEEKELDVDEIENNSGFFTDRIYTTSNEEGKLTFNPKDKENFAYYINNKASKYIDTTYFVSHNVDVPIYKGRIKYKEETKTVTYKLKISPPNLFDMYSTHLTKRGEGKTNSYWLLNTSTSSKRYCGVIADIGSVINDQIGYLEEFGVKAVAFTKKGTTITSGKGTYEEPYIIK